MKLRKILRAARALQDLSQRDVAKAIGSNVTRVCHIERGKAAMNNQERIALAKLLHIDANALK